MSTAVSTLRTQPMVQEQKLCAPEDTLALKIVSVIPLVGIITSLFAKMRLTVRIRQETQGAETPARMKRIIQLIDSKNHYEYANLARDLVYVALLVTGVAMGTLTFGLSTGISLAFFGWFVYTDVSEIQKNQAMIRDFQTRAHS